MKLAQLLETLNQFEPSTDVVIATKPHGQFCEFQIKQPENQVIERGCDLLALEVTNELGVIVILRE